MSAVLRGRNLPLEQSLGALAEAMKKQFPRHMVRMPGAGSPAHNIIVPAFLGGESRLYTIDLAFAPDRKSHAFRYTRHVVVDKPPLATPRTPRVGLAGSGALYLAQDKKWIRGLLRVVRANDRGQVSPLVVADHLASLNYKVHLGVRDKSVRLDIRDTVGPRCIVVWRRRRAGVHKGPKGGGGEFFYSGTTRDTTSDALPIISAGIDIRAIINVLKFDGMPGSQPAGVLLARLPDKPDENLR